MQATGRKAEKALKPVFFLKGYPTMARGIHQLTVLGVAKAARKGLTVCDGGGLYLQDGRSWIFRYTRNHKTRYAGLGPLALVDLAAAREAALAARKMLFAGHDPIDSRKAERAAEALKEATSITFDACCAQYIAAHRDGWKNAKHREQWETTLRTFASPVLGNLPVAAIDTGLVLRVLY